MGFHSLCSHLEIYSNKTILVQQFDLSIEMILQNEQMSKDGYLTQYCKMFWCHCCISLRGMTMMILLLIQHKVCGSGNTALHLMTKIHPEQYKERYSK